MKESSEEGQDDFLEETRKGTARIVPGKEKTIFCRRREKGGGNSALTRAA